MTLSRRVLPVAGATRRFLRRPARTAVTPDKPVFGLSSCRPVVAARANVGTAPETTATF
jgi:hypothetical protein